MTITISRHPTGWFALLDGAPGLHGAGSTPRLAIERLMDAAPARFGPEANAVVVVVDTFEPRPDESDEGDFPP